MFWLEYERRDHIEMVGKQANEVCSKQKLSLKNNSIGHYECEPITVKIFNCDAGTREGTDGAVSSNSRKQTAVEGESQS